MVVQQCDSPRATLQAFHPGEARNTHRLGAATVAPEPRCSSRHHRLERVQVSSYVTPVMISLRQNSRGKDESNFKLEILSLALPCGDTRLHGPTPATFVAGIAGMTT